MLEFIYNCTEFNIADRAKDCERNMAASNGIIPMAVLSEAVLKAMYYVIYRPNNRDAQNLTLYSMLSNRKFITAVIKRYGIRGETIDSLDRNVRAVSNDQKHGNKPSMVSDIQKRNAFISVFELCAAYYCVHYRPPVIPRWDEHEYARLVGVDRIKNCDNKDDAGSKGADNRQRIDVKPLENGLCNGSAALNIQAFPEDFTIDKFQDLLFIGRQNHASFEFLAGSESIAESKGVSVVMIIRMEDNSAFNLENRLNNCIELLINRLQYFGFDVSLIEDKEKQLLSEELNSRSDLMFCVPGEGYNDISSFYAPAGYGYVYELDIRYMLSIVSRYPGNGFSLHISNTKLSNQEKKAIGDNLKRLKKEPHTDENQRGIKSFEKLLDDNCGSLYFTYLTVWGTAEGLRYIVNNLQQRQFNVLGITRERLINTDYMTSGEAIVTKYAIERGHVLSQGISLPPYCGRLSYIANIFEVDKVFKNAFDIKKLPGIAINSASEEIQEIPEKLTSDGGIILGGVPGKGKTISMPPDMFSKHMVIAGMPGCGKTNLLFQIIQEFNRNKVPCLIIEPTKTEYRSLVKIIPDLKVLTPGRKDVCPIQFNPFLPPKGITLEQYKASLKSAFMMAFSMTTPLDVIFSKVLDDCYLMHGWDDTCTSDSYGVEIFGMQEFIAAFKNEISRSNYDPESKQNLISGGVYRFQDLITQNRFLFDTHRSISIESLLEGTTLIELDAIDNSAQRSLLITMILLQLKLVIRKNQVADGKLKNVILVDEAHVILDSDERVLHKNESDPSGELIRLLKDMIKVNRAYGTGLVFADQSVSVLQPFLDQSDIKAIMHLESYEDKRIIAGNIGLSNEICEKVTILNPGEFYLKCSGLNETVKLQAPDIKKDSMLSAYVSDKEIRNDEFKQERPFTDCPCKYECDMQCRTKSESIARKIYLSLNAETVNDKEALDEYIKYNLNDSVAAMVEDLELDKEKKVIKCTKFMFERMIMIERG